MTFISEILSIRLRELINNDKNKKEGRKEIKLNQLMNLKQTEIKRK